MKQLAKKSKEASKILMRLNHPVRKTILMEMAENLVSNKEKIISANLLDMAAAEVSGLNAAMKDRLKLDSAAIDSMASGVKAVAEQDEVVGVSKMNLQIPLV